MPCLYKGFLLLVLGMRRCPAFGEILNETLLAAFGRISSRLALLKVQRLYKGY